MIPPPFPEDIATAPLPRLSWSKLSQNESNESRRLLDASIKHGFFLLDLTDSPDGNVLLQGVIEAFEIGRRFFAEDLGVKNEYKVNSGNVGYKPLGVMKHADGKTDLTEICAVGRDSIMDASVAPIPRAYAERRDFLQSLIKQLHHVAMQLLNLLAEHLEMPSSVLEQYHNPSEPSATVLRFLHNPPQASDDRQTSLLGHTDSGSITILFPTVGGLQILPSNIEEESEIGWQWVKPEPGCAIVNLGDPMVQWTGGILRSAFHRVLYAPGAQAAEERYSFGYFLKPADVAPMKRIQDGGVIPKHIATDPEMILPHYDRWHQNKTKKILQGSNGGVSRGGTALYSNPPAVAT